jgi:signal transduction histidine kinase
MAFRQHIGIGFALMLVGLAALFLVGGSWGLFGAFGAVLLSAASGSVGEIQHLRDLFILQNAVLGFAVVVGALLILALVAIAAIEQGRRKAAIEIIRKLSDYAAGRWADAPHVHGGEELGEVAAALAELRKVHAAGEKRRAVSSTEAEEIKSRFMEIISHQLRTPLTAVRWNLEALLRGEVGEMTRKQEALLRITDKNYQNILVMLSDWVEALEVERGLLHLNPETVETSEFVESLAEGFRSQAKLKRLRFRVSVRKGTPPIQADRLKLHYVFSKLLHNAMSYTHEGGRVTMRAEPAGRAVRFEITDTGVGIPGDEQPEIFKKFFRASNATLMQPNASGVGLFVVKTLVEAHGGEIGFRSVEGKGTTFWFTMPSAEPMRLAGRAVKAAARGPRKA